MSLMSFSKLKKITNYHDTVLYTPFSKSLLQMYLSLYLLNLKIAFSLSGNKYEKNITDQSLPVTRISIPNAILKILCVILDVEINRFHSSPLKRVIKFLLTDLYQLYIGTASHEWQQDLNFDRIK